MLPPSQGSRDQRLIDYHSCDATVSNELVSSGAHQKLLVSLIVGQRIICITLQ